MDRRDFITLAALGLGGVALPGWLRAQGGPIVCRVRLLGSRVVMGLTIGGRGPYDFFLDTGGFLSLMDKPLADELKLSFGREVQGKGVGGRARLPVYLANDVVFGGGVRQSAVAFAVSDSFRFGQGVRGALAAGFLTAVDSDLDFEAGEWRAYPDGRTAREGVRMRNALIAGRPGAGQEFGSKRVFGDAAVNGRRGRFLLDTGAPTTISLDHETALRTGLWTDARPWVPMRPSGLGGSAGIARLVRAEYLEFAGVRFDKALVMLRAADDGSDAGTDGVVGLEVLKRFVLSTDVSAGDLWVRPVSNPGSLPDRYGMSGLWLDRRDGGMVVAAVGVGSPAAALGIAAGDGMTLAGGGEVLPAISGRPGATVALRVTRGGSTRQVELTLRPYL